MGFGFDACLELVKGRNRGLVYAEATAFGFSGPYATAGGYEHLAHFLTGIGHTQGLHHQYDTGKQEGKPVAVPINVLDISTGHTLAMGAIEALRRRANQGGSWLVQTSLLQVGMMMQSLGEHPAEVVEKAWGPYQPEPSTVDPERPFGGGSFGYFASFQCFLFRGGCPSAYKPEYLMTIKDCPWLPAGHTVKTVKPALEMGETPVRYRLSTRPFGFDSKHGRREFVDLHDGGDLVEEEHGIFRFVGKQAVGKL